MTNVNTPVHTKHEMNMYTHEQESHKIAQLTTARIKFQFPRVAAPRIMQHVYK